MPTRNVTVTLDEEVARWARLEAARRDTSVSRLLGEVLREAMLETQGYEGARRSYLSRAAAALSDGGRYPERGELHERDRLR